MAVVVTGTNGNRTSKSGLKMHLHSTEPGKTSRDVWNNLDWCAFLFQNCKIGYDWSLLLGIWNISHLSKSACSWGPRRLNWRCQVSGHLSIRSTWKAKRKASPVLAPILAWFFLPMCSYSPGRFTTYADLDLYTVHADLHFARHECFGMIWLTPLRCFIQSAKVWTSDN